jgi:hypothetical protein
MAPIVDEREADRRSTHDEKGFEWSVSIFIGPNTRSVLFSFSVTQTLASYRGDCNSGQLAACIGSGKKRLFMEFVFSVATSKTPKVHQAACRNVTRRWRIASVHQTTRRNQRLQLQVLCFLWSRWKQTFGIGGHERPQLSHGRCVARGFLAHKRIFIISGDRCVRSVELQVRSKTL